MPKLIQGAVELYSMLINYDYRLIQDSYSVWDDLLPSWVIKGADAFMNKHQFQYHELLVMPMMAQPVHDSLHFYTGLKPSAKGEDAIKYLEFFAGGDDSQMNDSLFICWNKLEQYQKDFYIEFYTQCPLIFEEETFEYFLQYKGFLYVNNRSLYDSLYNK